MYAPLRQIVPPAGAFVMTFIISGGIHDLATMAVSRSFAFLFTSWFFMLGVGAVLGRALSMDLGNGRFGCGSASISLFQAQNFENEKKNRTEEGNR